MRRLSGIDADMIYGETPSCHLHVSALLILDPSTAPSRFGIGEWRRLVASQLEHVPAKLQSASVSQEAPTVPASLRSSGGVSSRVG